MILCACAGLRFEDGQSMKKKAYQGPGGSIIYAAIRSGIHIMGGWVCLKWLVFVEIKVAG